MQSTELHIEEQIRLLQEEREHYEEARMLSERLSNFGISLDELAVYLKVGKLLSNSEDLTDLVLSELQEAKTLSLIERFVEFKVNLIKQDPINKLSLEAQKQVMPLCPDCSTNLVLMKIAVPKGPANRLGWKSMLQCPKCFYEEFSLKEFEERHQEYRRKRLKLMNNLAQQHSNIPKVIICPDCGMTLSLSKISEVKGPKNRFGYKSCLTCYNCGHQVFYTVGYAKTKRDLERRIKQELSDRIKEVENGNSY